MMDDNGKQKASDRLAQAASDWEAGQMKLPDAANEGFIPLPNQPAPPAPAMS